MFDTCDTKIFIEVFKSLKHAVLIFLVRSFYQMYLKFSIVLVSFWYFIFLSKSPVKSFYSFLSFLHSFSNNFIFSLHPDVLMQRLVYNRLYYQPLCQYVQVFLVFYWNGAQQNANVLKTFANTRSGCLISVYGLMKLGVGGGGVGVGGYKSAKFNSVSEKNVN